MKILNLLPIINATFWTEDMSEYLSKYLQQDTVLDTWCLDFGPGSIEGEFDEALAASSVVLKCIAAEKAGYDAIFVNCFAEPGVRAAREIVSIPVFGGFEPVVHYALGVGDKIGIVTVLPEVVPMISGMITRTGLSHRFTRLRYVSVPVLDLGDDKKVLVNALVSESEKAIVDDGADTIVLGCTGMNDLRENVERALLDMGYKVPVMEAGQAAVVMLETFVRMGLYHSRATYMKPRDKIRTWWGGEEKKNI